MKKSRKIAAIAASAVAASALAVSSGAYTGYLGFQNTVYSFRNAWNDGSYGLNSGNDAFSHVIVWGGNDPETFPELEDNFDYDITGYLLDVDYTDANITEDGTYTVALDGFDWSLDGATTFNLLFLDTDIPLDTGAKVTSISSVIDGNVTMTVTDPLQNPDEKEYVSILLENIWNTDIAEYTGGYPTKSLALQFTIEGLGGGETDSTIDEIMKGYENLEEGMLGAAAPAPAAGDPAAAVDSSKGSPDTGAEDVAVIAGLALAAGAGIVLSRKRK